MACEQACERACERCYQLHKECKNDCKYRPYFPAGESKKYKDIHDVFGIDNFMRMLELQPEEKRRDASVSMAYEAEIRVNDPIHGCYGKIRALEQKVKELEGQAADKEPREQEVDELKRQQDDEEEETQSVEKEADQSVELKAKVKADVKEEED